MEGLEVARHDKGCTSSILRKHVPSEPPVKHHNPLKNRNLQITIDKRSDRRYDFVCCLKEPSLVPPAALALTLDLSIACSLLASVLDPSSFVFNRLQPLFPKHPGGG